MRELTQQEKEMLNKRRSGLAQFIAEKGPVLEDFADRLGIPPETGRDTSRALAPIEEFMRKQVVSPESRSWILTRLGYLIGDVLAQKFSGFWFLNELPDSRYFLRYVVGRFAALGGSNAMVDPFEVADAYLSEPPGRDLFQYLAEVENGLREMSRASTTLH